LRTAIGYGLDMVVIRAFLAIVAALMVIGCGPAANAPSVTPLATQANQHTNPPSPAPDHTASTPAPSTDVFATLDDPKLTIHLPPGWRTIPIPALRDVAVQQSAAASGPIKDLYTQVLADIDSGAVRLVADGPSGVDPWRATMIVQVTDAASVDAQMAVLKTRAGTFGKVTSSEQAPVSLSIGTGERREGTSKPPAGLTGQSTAARAIDFVVKLDDGRILWINSTAPEASTTFVDAIDLAVGTISLP
jgi:hypothetical protein